VDLVRRSGSTRRPKWAAVGPVSARALAATGIEVDLVADQASGVGLAATLASATDLRGARVLLARAEAAARDLPEALARSGAQVTEVVAYRTVEAPVESAAAVAAALADPDLSAVVVASPSAVRGLVALAARAARADRLRAIPVVAIGLTTAAAAHDHGFTAVSAAETPSVDGLVNAVSAVLAVESPT
jgi:uroporphyrinogen-III synthase